MNAKLSLLRRMYKVCGGTAGPDVPANGPRRTAGEIFMRVLMGLAIFCSGIYAALALGLPNVVSPDDQVRYVGMFLTLMGLIFMLSAAAFVQHFFPNMKTAGQLLFCSNFVISLVIMLAGFRGIFDDPSAGVYLVLVGFGSALVAALAMR